MADFPVGVITDEFTQDFERICKFAQERDIPALEVRTVWDKNIVDMSYDEVRELKRLADGAGRVICGVASPVFKCTHPRGGDIDHRFEQDAFHAAHTYEQQPEILARALDFCEILEAPLLRVFTFWRTVEPKALEDEIIEALESALTAAEAKGVTVGVENEHACNMATGAEVAPALARILNSRLGLVWDPANSYVAGTKPFPEDYSAVPPNRIVHVHAKDGAMPAGSDRMQWGLVGSGAVDWPGQLAALVRDGYDGVVSLETHWGGPGGDKFQGSLECVEALKRLVAEA